MKYALLVPMAVFVLGVPVLLACFSSFSRLLAHMKAAHHSDWLISGKPSPMGWWEQGYQANCKAQLKAQWCSLSWLFKTPNWCTSDEDAMFLLRRYRMWVGLWNLGVMPIFIIVMLYAVSLDKAH
jgi:hypothetical protein